MYTEQVAASLKIRDGAISWRWRPNIARYVPDTLTDRNACKLLDIDPFHRTPDDVSAACSDKVWYEFTSYAPADELPVEVTS
jgi:hypothetical protein